MIKALTLLPLIGTLLAVSPVMAQGTPPASPALPGGASSLQETYEDWSVVCAQPNGQKTCAMSQQQLDGRTRQRVMAIELTAPGAGKVDGVLLLPFGLSFEQGVTLQIDEMAAGPALRFRTCLASGCLVPVSFDAKMIASLRKAASLKIKANSDNGQEVALALSLKGFGGALDRVATLMK